LVLDEILVRLRHPNSGVRKETLGGLKEVVISGGPGRDVGKIIRAIGGILADEVNGHNSF
jgi:pre-rRNA-processing protein IPI1